MKKNIKNKKNWFYYFLEPGRRGNLQYYMMMYGACFVQVFVIPSEPVVESNLPVWSSCWNHGLIWFLMIYKARLHYVAATWQNKCHLV